ncbi:MAG: heme ABC exporter ATP-binding protein CcmA [Lysobacterales bacterium]|nr:heme ABC exporter ATP-binding protein CcmA [Xanthomonadales bacterium]MCP5475968.1 heme ABC exporter ATP-binding protein CcmA [Rhodanobacteraceae bacterium]
MTTRLPNASPVSSAPPLLSATALTCLREDEALFVPIDIALAQGHLLVLEGRNGAGKTTLLRALLGLHAIKADSLHFRGADVLRERHALCAGTLWLGHLLALKGDLTVRENLHYNLAIGDEDDAVDVESLCTDLGLAGYEDTPTRALSAGQRKRAALARLAASRRSLWLLDEPFANLDGPGMAVVERLLEAHLARGGGAMLTSHGVLPITLPATTVRLEHPR